LIGDARMQVVLVGGLMTELHSLIAGVEAYRPTDDVDFLVNMMDPASTVISWHGRLLTAGFALQTPNSRRGPAHRYTRGDDVVDLMVPDNTSPLPRLGGRYAMPVAGGQQALRKLMEIEFRVGSRSVIVNVPDELGALIVKAAAHKADPRDKPRHLRDAALLASLIDDPIAERARFVGSDRSRVRYITEKLKDPFIEAWQLLPAERQVVGQNALRVLSE
jgi:hypothetical protein